MKNFLLDTNILLLFLLQDKRWDKLNTRFDLPNNRNFISVVTLGELHALALRNNWGAKRSAQIDRLKEEFVVLDINIDDIIYRYAEIDAFSQGKHPTLALGMSARSMGKNDLWIAATASVFPLTLITTDMDFNHLHSVFVDLQSIDIANIL